MSDDIEVTIKLGTSHSDFLKLKGIMEDMKEYKTTAIDNDDAVRQYKDELRRRLRDAGLGR